MDAPGSIIAGKYQLQEVAGSGGMATVWRAVHRTVGFERPVAIKRIREDMMGQQKFVDMFLEEARVSAQLMHPNIVLTHDFGEDGGCYFLVMEWVEGLSLARYLSLMNELHTLPPWHFVAAVGIESLRGLGAAHARVDVHGQPAPVFHRDVTPQNILLGVNGVVKITDFGLARAMDRARMTAPDMIKGKVGYLAPELTQAKHPTIQSDLYAMGVVMWQALAGQKLFSGKDHVDIFVAASKGQIPPLADIRPDVPPQFTDLIERALARDPSDRFRTASQMGRLIANLLRNVPERPDATYIGEAVREVHNYIKRGSNPPSEGLPHAAGPPSIGAPPPMSVPQGVMSSPHGAMSPTMPPRSVSRHSLPHPPGSGNGIGPVSTRPPYSARTPPPQPAQSRRLAPPAARISGLPAPPPERDS